jgi:hypothetical protein
MLRRILTFAGYLGITLLVLGVTFALVAYGEGYTYDFSTRRIIQKGHVIISSLPSGIRLTADGKELKKKTPYQAAYKVGKHTFQLVRDGYWPWQKTLEVVAGQVTLARYAILVPKEPETKTIDAQPQVVAQAVSRDHRHVAYITGGATAALYVWHVGDEKPTKLYTPKVATETEPAEVLSNMTWSDDASHLIIESRLGDQVVHRLAAVGGGEPVNLTAQYRFNFNGIKFSSQTWRQLYWISPDGLRRLDTENQSVSAVLAEKVTQFWVIPDRVLYVQQTELGRSLWSLDNRGNRQELIPALAESDTYEVAYATYRGKDELAIVPSKTRTATLYAEIFSRTPVAKVVAHDVTSASFSPDGHLLALTSPTAITTYDLERSQLDDAFVAYTINDQPGKLSHLTWFDNYHLLTVRDGKLYWSEFDGANRVELGAAVGGLPAHSTADMKNVLVFRPVGEGVGATVRLTQVQIRL